VRALCNGKTLAFQAKDAGSIPAARSMIFSFVEIHLSTVDRSLRLNNINMLLVDIQEPLSTGLLA
jgi:hypothetical protein